MFLPIYSFQSEYSIRDHPILRQHIFGNVLDPLTQPTMYLLCQHKFSTERQWQFFQPTHRPSS